MVSNDILYFVAHGFLGGVLWLLIHWKWTRKIVIQHTLVSALSGYIYYLLHSEYNFPNAVMSIVSGYFSVDFVKQIADFFGGKMKRE